MQIGLSSEEMWKELEPKLIKFKYMKGVDPILQEKIDVLINNHNGGLSKGYKDNILGKLETLIKILESKEFYRTRNIDESIMKKLIDLAAELDVFRKVLVNEINTSNSKEVKEKETRLPNLECDTKENDMYKDIGTTPKYV